METIPIVVLLALLFLHWVMDFIAQTDWQSKNKWHNWYALTSHTVIYALPFMSFGLRFWLATLITHTAIDFVTSKLTHKFADDQDWHNFFVVVGFDQWLHATQLVLTWYWMWGAR